MHTILFRFYPLENLCKELLLQSCILMTNKYNPYTKREFFCIGIEAIFHTPTKASKAPIRFMRP